ncbi:MFS transporter [Streptococcus castoreus]|uniref:MFS transporter n=1 Tax=Streptococcus castoreus TaxID=254786 RepID=UPI0004032405|nr:MFS transporter [Streptococcus castoreus]
MQQNEYRLLASRAINKIGNVIYDYGNSTWIANLGIIGQKYLGYYQLAENVIALILNPIAGAIADRYQRRKILLWTDFIGALSCGLLALIASDRIMLYGLITVNALLAISQAFSGTSFRAYVVTLIDDERLVNFNAHLEIISQIISISSPLLAFFIVDQLGLRSALIVDSISFALSFACLFSITKTENHLKQVNETKKLNQLGKDITQGLAFIYQEKEMFFLLSIAALANFFIAAFNYLIPFSNQLFANTASYASLLSMGAAGSILGAVLASKLFKNTYQNLLLALGLSGLGLTLMTPMAIWHLPNLIIVSGNFWFECFLTIFNIHFFSLVQKKVPKVLLGRVFSSIFTIAVLFMPLATALMTYLPATVTLSSFAIIGTGITTMSILAYLYGRKRFL